MCHKDYFSRIFPWKFQIAIISLEKYNFHKLHSNFIIRNIHNTLYVFNSSKVGVRSRWRDSAGLKIILTHFVTRRNSLRQWKLFSANVLDAKSGWSADGVCFTRLKGDPTMFRWLLFIKLFMSRDYKKPAARDNHTRVTHLCLLEIILLTTVSAENKSVCPYKVSADNAAKNSNYYVWLANRHSAFLIALFTSFCWRARFDELCRL